MKFRFLLIATACLGMIACSKNDGVTTDPSESGSKSIVMKIATPVTRAYITPDAPYQPSTDISSIDVYFTNSNSTIQSAYRLTGQDLDNITTSGLRFVNLNNVSAVFVVANSPKALLAAGDRMDNDFIANLSDQGPALDQGSMIFAGCDTDITPVALDTNVPDVPNYSGNTQEPQYDKDQVYTADITIRPLISRMEWGKITIESDGQKLVQDPNSRAWYLVVWKNWKPSLTGIFQSNVYLEENIFANTQVQNANLFATPTLASAAIENGAWKKPTSPVVGDDTWALINKAISYTGYEGSTPDAMLDLDAYNAQSGVCVPFHFFVPFDPSDKNAPDASVQVLPTTPQWHFQLYYPDLTNGSADPAQQFTVKVYKSDEHGTQGAEVDLDADDAALAIYGDFLFPTSTGDDLAYANVVELLDTKADVRANQSIIYTPGTIYSSDITIAPYNVSASFKDPSQYNIIVKVEVAKFTNKTVKPGFDADYQ